VKINAICRTLILILSLIAASAVLIPGIDTTQANGGSRPVVTDAIVGPYKMQVGIFPGKPRVGNLHLSITIGDATGEQTLTGATVFASLTGPAGATSIGPVPAANTPQKPQSYDIDMPLDVIGSWTLTLGTNSDLGPASIDVPLEVTEPEGFDLVLLIAGAVAILALVLWIQGRIKRTRSRSGS
jgi:hypothetical protein